MKTTKTLDSFMNVLLEKILLENESVLDKEENYASFLVDLQDAGSNNRKLQQVIRAYSVPLIGSGLSREVYSLKPLGKDLVLKVWNGLEENQNELEYKFYQSCIKDFKNLFTQIYEPHSPDFLWIIAEGVQNTNTPKDFTQIYAKIMEKLNVTEEEIEKDLSLLGLRPSAYGFSSIVQDVIFFGTKHPDGFSEPKLSIMKTGIKNNPTKIKPDEFFYIKFFEKSQWFRTLLKAVSHCKLNSEDFHDGNWGLRKNGDPVILDYGYDTEKDATV